MGNHAEDRWLETVSYQQVMTFYRGNLEGRGIPPKVNH
ncbi:hypothetical protein MITS9509_03478 [Synechococcus sp. MIT S9509]|nr:hypothetical protein MITS9504_03482 [Synechococcus sp. MIT S9504]KZR86507.1 hypothetical protein MITS9509_03478 [Synechococcus sp. MIT S9509]